MLLPESAYPAFSKDELLNFVKFLILLGLRNPVEGQSNAPCAVVAKRPLPSSFFLKQDLPFLEKTFITEDISLCSGRGKKGCFSRMYGCRLVIAEPLLLSKWSIHQPLPLTLIF